MLGCETISLELDPTWKMGIGWKLERFLAFAFPAIHRLIDWTVPPTPLDAELQKIEPENERGLLHVDKLFKVILLSREETLLYLHLEIQGQRDGSFEFRMWTYNYRLCDRFGPNVISLAVLVERILSGVQRPIVLPSADASAFSSSPFLSFGTAFIRRKSSNKLAIPSR